MLPLDYRRDERNAELSADNLRKVILDLLAQSPNITLHAIAHSMGNRVLASALQQITADAQVKSRLDQVAMVAPDIDAELFRRAARVAVAAKREFYTPRRRTRRSKRRRVLPGTPAPARVVPISWSFRALIPSMPPVLTRASSGSITPTTLTTRRSSRICSAC